MDLFHLTGRNVLVTGAASGIGRATAILLSQCGCNVILFDNNKEGLEETKSQCTQGLAYAYSLDLTDSDAIHNVIMQVVQEAGKLHGLVHCAGIPYISPLKTITKEHCEKVYQINTYAALALAKEFASKKVYAGEYGSIVLISSVYGLVGSAANVGYAMSKGAIIAITKSLAIELANKTIRVNCIAPGFIKTEMKADVDAKMSDGYDERLNALHPLGMGNPEDIANGIVYLLSDMSKWVTGITLSIDGGFTAQ